MRVVLIGADNEENLGLAMVAAGLVSARHQVQVLAFSEFSQLTSAVDGAMAFRPDVVGIAMQFQHRAWEFVALVERLRRVGFRGHLTAGGLFATMAHAELLSHAEGVDSVVLNDGEETMVELANALARGRSLREIAGLALRLDDGAIGRTPARRNPQDLDRLPFPKRYRPATRHFGIPFVPISGGRGCWGQCAFCSITSLYRGAHATSGGLRFRLRSPRSIALEMAEITAREESPSIFCFHDETLLLPRATDTLRRLDDLGAELDRLGVEKYGLIGKCRPDCLTSELAQNLADRGVIRLYVGIENASQAGQDHLMRRTTTEQLHQALTAIERAGIFGCYNLLIFEPDTTLDDVRENIQFIRDHAEHPVNFCRAEPYQGTPLWDSLRQSGELEGSWLGWDYHQRDPRVELLLRITQVAFRQRNFDPVGVANRSMSLGYVAKLLDYFHGADRLRVAQLVERAKELTRRITLDTAEMLDQSLEIVERFGVADRERVERETLRLGLRIAARDGQLLQLMDEYAEAAERLYQQQHNTRRFQIPQRLCDAVTSLALAGCVAATNPGCGGETMSSADEVPALGGKAGSTKNLGGAMVNDPLPASGGRNGAGGSSYIAGDPSPASGGRVIASGGNSYINWDPSPSTGGRVVSSTTSTPAGGRSGVTSSGTGGPVFDPLPSYGGRGGTSVGGYSGTLDPAPPSGGRGGTAARGGNSGVSDPLPPSGGRNSAGSSGRSNAGSSGKAGSAGSAGSASSSAGQAGVAGNAGTLASNDINVGHFRDTRSRRTVRRDDLALYDPAEIVLRAIKEQDHVRVTVEGISEPANSRWESKGKVTGSGLEVEWTPADDQDQLRIALRTRGGVTIAALRAKDVTG